MAKYQYTQTQKAKKPATPTSTTAEKFTGVITALMLTTVAVTGATIFIAMNIRPIWHGLNIAASWIMHQALPTASLFITSPLGIVALGITAVLALTLTIGICYYQNRNNKLAKAATKIQTVDGGHAAAKELKKPKAAAKIQTVDGGHAAAKELKKPKAAAKIQTVDGGHAAANKSEELKIQKPWHTYDTRIKWGGEKGLEIYGWVKPETKPDQVQMSSPLKC